MVALTPEARTFESPQDTATSQKLLEIRDLTVEFKTVDGALKSVNNVSFSVNRGRVLAVLGESGSGKSALLKTILGIQPDKANINGDVVLNGSQLLTLSRAERERIRGRWVAMVFQDPMTALDPLYTVEDQIVETLRRHTSMTRKEAAARALELLNLVEIPSPERRLKSYPFEMSGGMRQRVVIAIALACSPHLLLADEPTTALDVTVQARVLELLRGLREKLDMSIVLVTHDLAVAASIADDIAVMYAGRVVETGTVDDIVQRPRHPYTQGLLEANVRAGQKTRARAIPGSPPNLAHLPEGCSFAPRCDLAEDRCWTHQPALTHLRATHGARCLLLDEPPG